MTWLHSYILLPRYFFLINSLNLKHIHWAFCLQQKHYTAPFTHGVTKDNSRCCQWSTISCLEMCRTPFLFCLCYICLSGSSYSYHSRNRVNTKMCIHSTIRLQWWQGFLTSSSNSHSCFFTPLYQVYDCSIIDIKMGNQTLPSSSTNSCFN